MSPTPLRRSLALVVALTITVALFPTPARGADEAQFAGRVFETDGITPQSDVVVALYDETTEQIFRSDPTGDEGAFHVDGAPAGTYHLVAETVAGAFLAAEALELQGGSNPPLALTLQTAPGYQSAGQQQKSSMKPWIKWVIVGAILAVGLFLIYDVTKETEISASPS